MKLLLLLVASFAFGTNGTVPNPADFGNVQWDSALGAFTGAAFLMGSAFICSAVKMLK